MYTITSAIVPMIIDYDEIVISNPLGLFRHLDRGIYNVFS